jgi:hypothetical protein
MKILMFSIAFLATCCSCSNYYKVLTTNGPASPTGIEDLKSKQKYFILRNGTVSYSMNDISVSNDRKNLACTLDTVPDEHTVHLWNGDHGKMKYKKSKYAGSNEAFVLNEVHVYASPGTHTAAGQFTMPLSNVQRTEVIEKDIRRTSTSHVVGGLAIGLGVGLVVLAIAAAAFAATFSLF